MIFFVRNVNIFCSMRLDSRAGEKRERKLLYISSVGTVVLMLYVALSDSWRSASVS